MKVSAFGGLTGAVMPAATVDSAPALQVLRPVEDVQLGSQAARVQAAQTAMAAMPDVDLARIAEIKAALARGEIGFDPEKIAGLVMRHHRGR